MQDILSQMYPKIVQPKFNDVFTFQNLYYGAFECAKGVFWKASVQNYLNRHLSNTSDLYNLIINKAFRSPGFCHFVINERGKIRDINSVRIEERIVQKVLCELGLRPIIVPRLIISNCASLPGRGTSAALYRFKQDLAKAFRLHGKECYIIITDYHGYYDSIDHVILLNEFYNWIEDKDIFDLFSYFVSTFVNLNQGSRTISTLNSLDPSLSPSINNGKKTGIYQYTDLEMFDWYDDNSYFDENTKLDIGLGLGSEVSQLSAVAYINPIDHGIKEIYNIESYTRYMDDSYLIDHDLVKLKECFAYMQEESLKYRLTYNPKHTNTYRITDHYTFLKKRTHVDPVTGKVIMRLLDEAIIKHRHTFKNQRHLLDQDRISMEDIYNCFYSWRESVKYLDSRNTLIQLTNEFINIYRDKLSPQHIQSLYRI